MILAVYFFGIALAKLCPILDKKESQTDDVFWSFLHDPSNSD